MKKQIHTTMDEQLHKLCVINDLKWSSVIETGAKVLLGCNGNKRDEIDKKLFELGNQMEFWKQRKEEIGKIESEIKEKEKEATVMEWNT